MSAEETKHYLANGQATAPDAREALEWARETTAQMVDLKFCDLLGTLAAHDAADPGVRRVRVRRGPRLRRLVDPRLAGHLGVGHAADAGCRRRAILDPFTEAPTLSLICEIADPITTSSRTRRIPRGVAKKAEDYLRSTGIADTAYMGPECEFFVFDEVSYELGPNRSHYAVDSAEGHWNSGKPGLGYTMREKEGYFPPAPHDTLHDLRTRDGADARAARDPVRVPPPRGRVGRPVRDRPPLPAADAHGRSGHDLQVRRQERRPRRRQVGDVHAEADLRRQRLGHAHASVAVEGGDAADGGQVRLRRALAARPRVRRRPAGARSGAAGVLRSDDELVPAARARLRGAGEPRLLACATAARASASRCTRTRRRRSGSSSAARTPRRIRISRSRRC